MTAKSRQSNPSNEPNRSNQTSQSDESGRPPPTPDAFRPLVVAVDVVLARIERGELRILLVQRPTPPFQGMWALPGGVIMEAEALKDAVARTVREVAGIEGPLRHIEQVGAYGDPKRDPRTRVVTVGHWAIPPLPPTRDESDAEDANEATTGASSLDPPAEAFTAPPRPYQEFVPAPEIESGRLRIAFDHARIISDALERIRLTLESTTVARRFCPDRFTISELRKVYEAIWGTTLDPGNFQRKVLQSKDFIAPVAQWNTPGRKGGRPARLWRAPSGRSELVKPFPRSWRLRGEPDEE